MKTIRNKFAMSSAFALCLSLSPRLGLAQVPPRAVLFTDLTCHNFDFPQPPLGAHLFLQHLNPLISTVMESVDVLEPQQLCTPVQKNEQTPPPDVIDFVSYLDLKCYHVEGPSALQGANMVLKHLNPLLAALPEESAQLLRLSQLCVPVNKLQDGVIPQPIPPAVIDFIKNVDVACYDIFDQSTPLRELRLTELNPMFDFPRVNVTMYRAQQLCLPVQKSFEPFFPPLDPAILDVVSQLDFLRYEVFGNIPNPNFFLGLRHLNPVLADYPDEQVVIHEARQLMVPVSKRWPGTGGAAE